QFATRSLHKRLALLRRELQAVGQPRGQLFGRPALVGLNETDGHHRAANLWGQLFAGQVERSAAPPHPGAEREQLTHGLLQAAVRHTAAYMRSPELQPVWPLRPTRFATAIASDRYFYCGLFARVIPPRIDVS